LEQPVGQVFFAVQEPGWQSSAHAHAAPQSMCWLHDEMLQPISQGPPLQVIGPEQLVTEQRILQIPEQLIAPEQLPPEQVMSHAALPQVIGLLQLAVLQLIRQLWAWLQSIGPPQVAKPHVISQR
jgi:hypothetical protein